MQITNDKQVRATAVKFARQNKIRIAKELTDTAKYTPDAAPVSAFMAGSPGAGKTEFSRNLISILETDEERKVVRIDGDELRSLIPGYTGGNSRLFQGAISLIVEKMHDLVLHNGQSFVLDSTLAKYPKAADNIKRSLDKNRPVFIFYIHQEPKIAWGFTQAREAAEGRNIPKEAFIEQFLGARETVNKVSMKFGARVTIFLVKKDFEKNSVENISRITSGEQIDAYIPKRYIGDELKKLL